MPDRVEVFGQTGVLRLGADEGQQDSVAAYGGSVMVPVFRKWALDVSVVTAYRESTFESVYVNRLRRTLITPVLAYRFGSPRVYGFLGGGIGAEINQRRFNFPMLEMNPGPISIVVVQDDRDSGPMYLISRGGVVWNPASRLLIRGDVELAFRYVYPNVTARIGAGWRF